MLVNLKLKESGTWICRKDSKITETVVRGAALDIELTDAIRGIVNDYDNMVEIVPREVCREHSSANDNV